MTTLRWAVLGAALIFCAPAAAFDCPQFFVGGRPPVVRNAKLLDQSRELCFRGFATLHSGVSRGPIFSSEHLIGRALEHSHPERRNVFHAESRLPASERAELHDYARSGFDRGHMAPSGDMPDAAAQAESFSLANMTPQAGSLNRGPWAHLEERVRQTAIEAGELYVVTGPLFEGETITMIGGRVLVPSHTWKATVNPQTGDVRAWIAANTDAGVPEPIDLPALEQRIGLRLFSTPEATHANH